VFPVVLYRDLGTTIHSWKQTPFIFLTFFQGWKSKSTSFYAIDNFRENRKWWKRFIDSRSNLFSKQKPFTIIGVSSSCFETLVL